MAALTSIDRTEAQQAQLLRLIGATALEMSEAYWRGVADAQANRQKQCPYLARTIKAAAWTIGAQSSSGPSTS